MKNDYYLSELRAVSDFEAFGAEKVPFSGAQGDNKLDIVLHAGKLTGYRISNKHTTKRSFSVNLDDWHKDVRQGIAMGSKVLRRVEIENPVTGKLEKFIVIDQDLFKELLAADE